VPILKLMGKTFVFCYHRVIPVDIVKAQSVHRALYITPDTFENHIKWMRSIGEIVTADSVMEKSRHPKFVVTFDDGWRDNYDYAFPILNKYAVPAVVFISTDNIDQDRLFWSEEIGILIRRSPRRADEITSKLKSLVSSAMEFIADRDRKRINANWNSSDQKGMLDRFIECMKVLPVDVRNEFLASLYSKLEMSPHTIKDLLLSWEQISIMKAQGIAFGSHTHTHAIVDRMDAKAIESELCASKKLLERHLGEPISLFSYPNGWFRNIHIQASLKKYGYRYAFTLERSWVLDGTDPFIIPRCLVYEDIAADLGRYYTKLCIKTLIAEGRRRAERFLFGQR
jgi:peptidoglycan/xylan/chitin deacetylase (PgdA/CDA1 family)